MARDSDPRADRIDDRTRRWWSHAGSDSAVCFIVFRSELNNPQKRVYNVAVCVIQDGGSVFVAVCKKTDIQLHLAMLW